MIQRLQTILLFLAAGAMVAFLFLPTFDVTALQETPGSEFHKETSISATPTKIKITKFDNENIDWNNPSSIFSDAEEGNEKTIPITENIFYLLRLITVGLVAGILLVTIFLYNNRSLQIKLSYGAIILTMVQFILAFPISNWLTETARLGMTTEPDASHKWGLGIPLLALLLTWWAIKRIQKDEKLVRGMDRIR
jgi:hypothetical protein